MEVEETDIPQDTPNGPAKPFFHWSRLANNSLFSWLTKSSSSDDKRDSTKTVSINDDKKKEPKSDTGVKSISSVNESKKSVSASVNTVNDTSEEDSSSDTSSDSSSDSSTTHTPSPCSISPNASMLPRNANSIETVRTESSEDSGEFNYNIEFLTYEPGDTFKRSITCNEDFFQSTRVADELTYPDIFFSTHHYRSMIKSALSCFFLFGRTQWTFVP